MTARQRSLRVGACAALAAGALAVLAGASGGATTAGECLSYTMTPITTVYNPTAPGKPLVTVTAPVPTMDGWACGIPNPFPAADPAL